jgi:hypothetical protein
MSSLKNIMRDLHPFKTKRVSYIRTQGVPRNKPSQPRLYKTSLLMLCKVKVAVCSEIVQNT